MTKPSQTVVIILVVLVLVIAGIVAWWMLRAPSVSGVTATSSVMVTDGIESVSLTPSIGQTGTAVATRSFANGNFLHGITANVPDPTDGKVYQAWLLKNGDSTTAVATGTLVKDTTGYTLDFSSATDYRSYSDVWVTLQSASDQGPKTLVLSGSFR